MSTLSSSIDFIVISGGDGLLAVEAANVYKTIKEVNTSSFRQVHDTTIFILDGHPLPLIDLRHGELNVVATADICALILQDRKRLSVLIVDDIVGRISIAYGAIQEIKNTTGEFASTFEGYFYHESVPVLIVNTRAVFRHGMPISDNSEPYQPS